MAVPPCIYMFIKGSTSEAAWELEELSHPCHQTT